MRNHIYDLVLADDQRITSYSAAHCHLQVPAILRTTKIIRREAIGLWLDDLVLTSNIPDHDGAWLYNSLARDISSVRASALTGGAYKTAKAVPDFIILEIHTGSPNWQNLLAMARAKHDLGKEWAWESKDNAAWSPSLRFANAVLAVVDVMRERPWAEVEEVLQLQRSAVSALEPRWR